MYCLSQAALDTTPHRSCLDPVSHFEDEPEFPWELVLAALFDGEYEARRQIRRLLPHPRVSVVHPPQDRPHNLRQVGICADTEPIDDCAKPIENDLVLPRLLLDNIDVVVDETHIEGLVGSFGSDPPSCVRGCINGHHDLVVRLRPLFKLVHIRQLREFDGCLNDLAAFAAVKHYTKHAERLGKTRASFPA